jgi:ABC-type glycerol-3-phosphate transport system permease component
VTDWTARRAGWLGASFLLFFAAWECAGRWPISPAFPPFSQTLLAFGRMTLDGSFARAYASTLQPLVIGVAISAALGVGAGVAMGLNRSVEWLTLPLFVIAQAAPMAAIIPMITYVYGIGLTAKVLAVTVLAVPVIAMNSYKGIRNTSPSLLEMCRSFLGTRGQAVRKIVLPLMKPAIVVLGIFTFMFQWVNFLWPLVITTTDNMKTLTVGVASLQGQFVTNWGVISAAAVMTMVPVIIIFLVFQRWFVQASMAGALKQ